MNISVFSSDAFYTGLRIMLTTFLNNNKFEKHNIFVISEDISEKKIRKLNIFLKRQYNQEVQLLRITKEMIDRWPSAGRLGAAGYHKLYVFEKLPQKLDRIMCLDSDVLVMNSLKDFYYQDMGGSTIVATRDNYENGEDRKYRKKSIGLSENDIYYNLGVIIIDLDKSLQAYDYEEYIEWINNCKGDMRYVVQDVVNALFKGRIKEADGSKYNFQCSCHRKITDLEWKEIEEDKCIVHAIAVPKPWDFEAEGKLAEYARNIMKSNKMKKDYYRVKILHTLYKMKNTVQDFLKGKDANET